MKLIKEEEHKLLDRKRIIAEIMHEKNKTPTTQEVIKQLAENLKVNPELIKLRHIYTHFGASKSKIIAHVYNNLATLKALEEFRKKKKIKKAKEQKPEAKTE
ncbi:MAG: hypothetical protein AABX55_01825 [Nanoarchaeota archaeon]